MCYARSILVFLPWFFNAFFLQAQEASNYNFQHIDQRDGLIHNKVLSITQDEKGFIWIITTSGLQRYDGSKFLNFSSMVSNPSEQRAEGAAVYSDSTNHCLWVMNIHKLEKLALEKNHFTVYDAGMLLQDSGFHFERYTDETHTAWLLGSRALFIYDSSLQKFNLNTFNINPFNTHAGNYFAADSSGNTWVAGNARGLYLFHYATKRVYTGDYNPLHEPLLEAFSHQYAKRAVQVRHIMIDNTKNYWITMWNDVFFRYNTATKKLSTYSLSGITKQFALKNNSNIAQKIINSIYEDNHGIIWIATENDGLLKYNAETDNFESVLIDEKNAFHNQYNYAVNCIFQDREENIWLGTDKGITIFNPYRQYYRAVHHDVNNPQSLPAHAINCFMETRTGNLLAGTWGGGITIYDSAWNFKKTVSFKGAGEYNLIWSFVQSDDGDVWAGCQHGYIHLYNPLSGSVRTIHPPELNNSTVRCMVKDTWGNIWLGLHNGQIVQYSKADNQFHRGKFAAGNEKLSPVLHIFFDSKKNCWVNTESGFKRFDTNKKEYTEVYLPDAGNALAISGKTMGGIEQYNDSLLMIGTVYGGLNFFNTKTNTFSHLSTKDGLPSNNVYAVKKDVSGNIWFTTDYGLYRFRLQDKKFIRYTLEANVINSPFNSEIFSEISGGRWVTATETELICFHPVTQALSNTGPGKVEVTEFRIFDNTVWIDSLLAANQPVRLTYQQNFITVEFALLNFSRIQQTKYYYRLSGVNSDWVSADRQSASYTNLEPGEYTFSVKADDAETSFKIIITPPFWKTIWFNGITAIALVLLVYFFLKWRIKSIKAVEAEKLKVQQLNAEQYKNQLELEQIVNYFSSSLIDKNTVDDVLWDVTKNLIGRLGFEDCMIYLWNSDKTKMTQRAGFGPKGSIEQIKKQPFDVSAGQGVVGYVMQSREPVFIPDTSVDPRYRADEMVRLSEITVPIIYNDGLIGVIDSEHQKKHFFTQQHIQVLSTIATLAANKIASIESAQSLQEAKIEMLGINEKLSEARLEALRSQMNPHFIFNCLNSIDNLIQNNDKEKATLYLAKFARLIRAILETSKNNTVPCWKDMETLKVYIELEELRLDKKFAYTINIADDILQGDYKVPPLVIQPFVENAIHHGLMNKITTDRKLCIHVWPADNYIHYAVEDNGVGRSKAAAYKALNRPAHESMGMQISIDRINLFSRNNNGSVVITDLYDENDQPAGTRIAVTLMNQ